MDRFPSYSRPPYGAQMVTRFQRGSRTASANFKDPDFHDDVASISGSDDGNYALLHESSKHDVDHESEGADLALTSQTLNADGTPKRPMNAFMIFARRRRPQVSADNQAMRTGEISKLLSKEWSSMAAADKQFYQDQAKLLKDTFNTKYPDYVYRRRPNNSRRRRRSDASAKASDGTGDGGEDGLSVGDFESPTDGEEHYDESGESSYSRGSHEPPTYGGDLKYPAGPTISRSSTHPFHSNHSLYRSNDSRLPYPSSSERMSHHTLGHRFSNPSLSNYSLSSSNFSNDMSAPQSWHSSSRVDRSMPSAWPQDRALPSLKTGSYPGSSGGWPTGLSSSNGHTSSASSYGGFSTLNTPFYPSQSSLSDYSSNSSSGNPQYEPPLSLQPIDRSYDSRGGSLTEPLTYPARNSMSRALPPVASLSGYPTQLQTNSGSMGSSHFWPRS